MKKFISLLLFSAICASSSLFPEGSKSFELRYYSDQESANGETDFKGPTEVFATEQRVEFLKHYADVASDFFEDPELDTKVVQEKEVDAFLGKLKPQPKPETRNRISLNDWKYLGYRHGQHEEVTASLARWAAQDGVDLVDQMLVFQGPLKQDFRFPMQSWRSTLQWRTQVAAVDERVQFIVSERGKIRATTIEFADDGKLYYFQGDNRRVEIGDYVAGQWYDFRLEFDYAAFKRKAEVIRFNLYVNGKKVADYVPIQRVRSNGVGYAQNFTSMAGFNQFTVRGQKGTRLDDIWGVGYHPTGRESYPYTVETFLDESFDPKPDVAGWAKLDYNDEQWAEGSFPIVHGSERHAEEDLYLRRIVQVGDFDKAYLNIETIDPSGEIWINGKVVRVVSNRHPQKVDISKYLIPNERNLIGVKVDHFYLTEQVGEIMPHSYLDFNLGWFAGRMSLDLVGHHHIDDVFIYTSKLTETSATLRARLTLQNDHWVSFAGSAEIQIYPWFPKESRSPVLTVDVPLKIGVGVHQVEQDFDLKRPSLWSPESPNLYKVRVLLKDENGTVLDDFVSTTGVRTVDQEGGSFRLNGKVSMANGAQIMGFRGPIENLALWNRTAPDAWVAKELLMVQRMNGNLLRIHSHGWEFPARGINDPRYAEMADQMGIMLLWCPTAWIRTGRGWGDVDFEGFPKYIKQVYNHPSIIIWEAANHTQSFKGRDVSESNLFCDTVHDMIYPLDPSRIISYNSYIWHLHYGNDQGTIDHEGNPITPSHGWTAPKATRGNQDSATGYGKDWSVLRKYPGAYRESFLNSRERAYFNFEHQQSRAQPNWNLVKGKPWYRLHSYEWEYDEGSIGRRLSLDEWKESQAWQAFSAWEAMKKMRFLDYDGFSWCCLHGGANSGTYKKPLIDFMDHAKLAYWANKMAFQKTVAGSHDVDVVYGPNDEIKPVVMHWGEEKSVDLTVRVKSVDGKVIEEKVYPGIDLSEGREAVSLKAFQPDFKSEGYYIIEYVLD